MSCQLLKKLFFTVGQEEINIYIYYILLLRENPYCALLIGYRLFCWKGIDFFSGVFGKLRNLSVFWNIGFQIMSMVPRQNHRHDLKPDGHWTDMIWSQTVTERLILQQEGVLFRLIYIELKRVKLSVYDFSSATRKFSNFKAAVL